MTSVATVLTEDLTCDPDVVVAICTAIEQTKRKYEKEAEPDQLKEVSSKGKSFWLNLKKKIKKKEYSSVLHDPVRVGKVENDLEEITDMNLMLDEANKRERGRRDGIAERNQTERTLVHQTLKNIAMNKNIDDLFLI